MSACPICTEPVAPGHGRRYCSVRCRRAAERAVARDRAAVAFAGVVDLGSDGILTRDQILLLLTAAARGGSVPAMKTLLEELRRDGAPTAESPSIVDELAKRRTGGSYVR